MRVRVAETDLLRDLVRELVRDLDDLGDAEGSRVRVRVGDDGADANDVLVALGGRERVVLAVEVGAAVPDGVAGGDSVSVEVLVAGAVSVAVSLSVWLAVSVAEPLCVGVPLSVELPLAEPVELPLTERV